MEDNNKKEILFRAKDLGKVIDECLKRYPEEKAEDQSAFTRGYNVALRDVAVGVYKYIMPKDND